MAPAPQPTQTNHHPASTRGRARLSTPKKIFFSVFILVVAVCAIEGFAHFITFGIDYPRWARGQLRATKEKAHKAIQYDSELGWVLTPNVRDPDYFGKGFGLTVNG